MSNRLLRSVDLPNELWSADTLFLPDALNQVYEQMLKAKGLYEDAKKKDPEDGPVGGIKESDTKKHFVSRFSGSAARMQLAMLDPKKELSNSSDLFIKAFSGGTVGLLDIPSGAGAATIDLLLTVSKLREKGMLPRQPLTVKLVCGDISEHARLYAVEMIDGIRDHLRKQGICVCEQAIHWDVCDSESTTTLLHEWMTHAPDCREYFVVLANFSGFLQSSGKFKEANLQLDEIFRWAGQRRSTVIWLEPQTNTAIEGLIPRISSWFDKKLPKVFRKLWKAEEHLRSDCKYRHPIKGIFPKVHLSLIRLEASES